MAKTKTRGLKIDLEPLVDLVGMKELVRQIGLKRVVDEVGLKRVVDELGARRVLQELSVDDLVAGLVAGGFTAGVAGEVFNLGTSIETQVIEMANLINHLTGNKAGVHYLPRRDWDHSEKKAADFSKAQRLLNWQPRARIPQGLEETYRWFLEVRPRIAETQKMGPPVPAPA